MKKIVRFLISLILVFGIVSCTTGTNGDDKNDPPAVVNPDGKTDGKAQNAEEGEQKSSTEKDGETGTADKNTTEDKTEKDPITDTAAENGTSESDSPTEKQTEADKEKNITDDNNNKSDDEKDKTDDENTPWYEMEFDIETPNVELPSSVGENPLKGKTFKENIQSGDAAREERTWIFSDDTVTENRHRTDENTTTKTTYRYSYNAEKNVIYMAFKSEERGDYYWSNMDEYWNVMKEQELKSMYKDVPMTREYVERMLKNIANVWAVLEVNQYTIAEDTITFKRYFDPANPNYTGFRLSRDKTQAGGNSTLMNFKKGEGLWLWPENSTGNGDGYHCMDPELKDGKLSGEVIYCDEIIGTIKGTYSTTGEGTSDCTMTIIFSELPELMTEFETGKEYVLHN